MNSKDSKDSRATRKMCEKVREGSFFFGQRCIFCLLREKFRCFQEISLNLQIGDKNNNKPISKDTTKRVLILKLRDTILIILNLREMRENERKNAGKFVAQKFSNCIIFINCVVDLCLFAE